MTSIDALPSSQRRARQPVPFIDPTNYSTEIGKEIFKLTQGGPELIFSTSYNWPIHDILDYIKDNAITIPPLPQVNQHLTEILLPAKQVSTTIPTKYRIPLMWVSHFMWASVKMSLPPTASENVWAEWKSDIVHVCILISTFLAYARDDTQRNVMTKNWRWHILDRPLSRYFHGWISSHEDQIQEFEDEFGDTAYYPNKEILDENWRKAVTTGIAGFKLTKEQIQNGITAEEFYRGLHLVPGEPPTWAPDPAERRAEPEPIPTSTSTKDDMDVDPTPARPSNPVASTSQPPARSKSKDKKAKIPPRLVATAQSVSASSSTSARRDLKRSRSESPVVNGNSMGPELMNGVEESDRQLTEKLTELLSSGSLVQSIPVVVKTVMEVIRTEREQSQAAAQTRIDQILAELKQREGRLERKLKDDAKDREKRILQEIRKLGDRLR
ncbi:hypothetical protein DL96DRAFT_1591370 [Flagelloscypha sp. PMI_526]|nr:hypothetical protein DL96DRAFT_1591370 [Flagelloscypha sp. PMI_526]